MNLFNIDFNVLEADAVLSKLEKYGVETEECLAYDLYDKEERRLFSKEELIKLVEEENNPLYKIVKVVMVLENGGFDVSEYARNDKDHYKEYMRIRNNILASEPMFIDKNLAII